MEPMNLGSLPGSPSSPGTNSNFLPSFLIGDSQPSPSGFNASPGRNKTIGAYSKNSLNHQDGRNLKQRLFSNSISENSPVQSPFVPLSEKGGPPKQGLFDTLEPKKNTVGPILSSTITPFGETPAFNESFSRINDESITSARNDTINLNNSFNLNTTVNRMERIDSHWVTIFGFPPSALSLVLAQFSHCGTIIEKILPVQGNWVHLKFSSTNEVSRALTLNGKCFNNCIMIGVNLYHNSRENKENSNVYTSPIRGARSLRQSFTSPQNLNNSVVTPQNVPQKSTGLVTKAMEYVFGW